MDDTTLFRVVLHLLVIFTEQFFATLVSSGGNRRLPLAALNNRDFCGQAFRVPPFANWWTGGVLPPHFAEKSRRPFQISCSVPLCGYLVVKFKS